MLRPCSLQSRRRLSYRKYRRLGLTFLLVALSLSDLTAARLTITWQDNASNESGFELERAVGNGAFVKVATLAANTTQYVDHSLAGDTKYRYRVRAFNQAGASGYSNIAAAAIPRAQPPSQQRPKPGDLSSVDIGPALPAGLYIANGTTHEIRAGGRDIWDANDEFHFAARQLTGDQELVARVARITKTHDWAKAGLMFRASTDPASAHVSLFITPTSGVLLQWRAASGELSQLAATPGSAPWWLKLTRRGNTFIASSSANGSSWTTFATISVNLPGTTWAGLAVSSHAPGYATAAVFESVSLGESSAPPRSSGIAIAFKGADVGTPSRPGLTSSTIETYTLVGGGADIWSTSDQFQFAEQTLSGDAEITVLVASQTEADPWTKAGIMFRSSLAADAANVALLVTPDNGVILQWRGTNGDATYLSQLPGLRAPIWLRLMRHGGRFYGFYSHDNVRWDLVDYVDLDLAASVHAGLAVTSHNSRATTTAVFKELVID